MRYVITENLRITPKALHIVNLSGSPLEIHNQARSLKTFTKLLAGDIGKMDHWFLVKEYDEYFNAREKRDEYLRKQLPLAHQDSILDVRDRDVQLVDCVYHNTLWDFYATIGYDHISKSIK